MALYRKKTLRRMSPTARKVARLAGELDSVAKRLKNIIPDLQRLDLDSKALASAKAEPIDAELLEACEGLVASFVELGLEREDSELLKPANKAIAKAKQRMNR